eukprot:766782-Hanusia_phi.AAC.6
MKAETDYKEEAKHTERMRAFLGEDSEFRVPRVRTRRTRTRQERGRRKAAERSCDRQMLGVAAGRGRAGGEEEVARKREERNKIAFRMMKLTLRELFEFNLMQVSGFVVFISLPDVLCSFRSPAPCPLPPASCFSLLLPLLPSQTDPNWSNFLYDREHDVMNLIDFGATQEYPLKFCYQEGPLLLLRLRLQLVPLHLPLLLQTHSLLLPPSLLLPRFTSPLSPALSDPRLQYAILVKASAEKDREKLLQISLEMGFLTGPVLLLPPPPLKSSSLPRPALEILLPLLHPPSSRLLNYGLWLCPLLPASFSPPADFFPQGKRVRSFWTRMSPRRSSQESPLPRTSTTLPRAG